MKILRILADHSYYSLLAVDLDYYRKTGVFRPEPKARQWEEFGPEGPVFHVREPSKTKKGNFHDLILGVLACDEAVRQSAIGRELEKSGEWLPARLEHPCEPVHVFNALTVYDCFDLERSRYAKAGTVINQVFEYVFKPELVGECSVFKTQVGQNTSVFTVADRGDPDHEFFYEYQKAGFTGLVFEEVWSD
jgi:hypothetical protein